MQPQRLTVDRFIALESQVWDAFVAGDAEADARVLADNFIGVYSTGLPGNRLTLRPCETGLWRGDTKLEIHKF
jgi:hypothetical protein